MSVLSKKLPLFFKLGDNLCCKRVNNLFTFFLLVKEKEELKVDIVTIFKKVINIKQTKVVTRIETTLV
jgi:hypothetical protein